MVHRTWTEEREWQDCVTLSVHFTATDTRDAVKIMTAVMRNSQKRTDWMECCQRLVKQVVGGRPPRYAPPLSSPRGRRSAFRRRADGSVAAVSHRQHVPTPTAAAAWCANTAVSKAAWWPWPLIFWSWKWCPSHVWRGLPLWQFWSS